MKEKWMVINKKEDFIKLTNEYEINPLIARLLANRGIVNKKEASLFLKGTVNDLNDASLMKDMKKAVSIIKGAIEEKKKIVIYGDYDCDGVCSTTILYRTLKKLGANFDYYIPNREDEGYGMNSDRIRKLKSEGAEVILTCDNGISAMEQVEVAKELGLTVIITDHHDIPYIEKEGNRINVVPNSDCVINPKQGNCEYPFKELCGAGVALKFSMELVNAMGRSFSELYDLFQYAAIATICDVVELLGENRIIVKEGLKLINNTSSIGLKALIKATGLEGKEISEYHFGFVLGPCINATGRLETADLSVELLITEDEKYAEELAKKLYDLNVERQELTFDSVESVISKVEEEITNGEKVILVYDEGIHESIAGIVAGRVRERFNLPAIVMTKGKDMPKGSARSIEGYNMFEELNKCKEYIEKFGGHPMAAGLSVKEENISLLRKALNSKCTLSDEDIIPVIKIDSPLEIKYLDESLVEEIESLRPFGKGNGSPLFAVKNIKVSRVFFIGKEKNFMKFRFGIPGTFGYVEGLNFDKYEEFKDMFTDKYGEEKFLKLVDSGYADFNMDIIYYPTINEFNGKRNIQLNVKNFRL
ncbi:single-stranded-DNA-specific exonuclease RecJ [Clostridium paraputrificum]|uniref:single-stranded-DNA-specific exonuclease RecJ n=1 Tax=Clostridium TaxID=1485 RepID=UPI000DCFE0A0|nr:MULTISPECIES: single-stranded-DNA-specific exonuclease RecJ [Clostridium]MDB2074655.1 single-stranded-DNA-specific exonuclease RecJ [Clostridium paraputrificum]MDB2077796.1 single-stranded-DNA-specific exonuclease RecJ [Clostridium paraputrificum]MDB2092733.1 single-stranded-DNA-specific exonuclease RecJ [Clostridium paraputrificum]MDB2098172.1 single-stranded-DNA-specific exonuclease RecJ [Clostridium paraputrificum]MDU3409401.1 single-stranded-DNA-specific exonuclease RecJ [Clostridium sp